MRNIVLFGGAEFRSEVRNLDSEKVEKINGEWLIVNSDWFFKRGRLKQVGGWTLETGKG